VDNIKFKNNRYDSGSEHESYQQHIIEDAELAYEDTWHIQIIITEGNQTLGEYDNELSKRKYQKP